MIKLLLYMSGSVIADELIDCFDFKVCSLSFHFYSARQSRFFFENLLVINSIAIC